VDSRGDIMQRIVTRKKSVIKFTNTKAVRVGKGIKALRTRRNMTLQQVAEAVGVSPNYLDRLEEGYEPEVARWILEGISEAVGVYERGGSNLTDEKLVDIFLYAAPEIPPELFKV